MELDKVKIAVIGLGYVGLPLAMEFGKKFPTIGFDISKERVSDLETGYDQTQEVDASDFSNADKIVFTSQVSDLASANVYVITVPTPINEYKHPDFTPLLSASETVGRLLAKNDIVIYESTVYPGATEEKCVPVLEQYSGLEYNIDFFVGYSPERVNPGDKEHKITSILKVVSGSTEEVTEFVDRLYSSIISAGTHRAPSIRVAEAAKVIENTQRDVNIALVNELAMIFSKLDIDTEAVLTAAGTKWNFLPFRPGLVGGHCIGVDPYYLTHKAQSIGYHPEIILAGRRINDNMSRHVASELVKAMLHKSIRVNGAKVLIMGLTFKENCPDIRNTKVVGIVVELQEYGSQVEVYDPWVEKKSATNEYGIEKIEVLKENYYDAVVMAVAHQEFKELGIENIKKSVKSNHVVYDLKYIFDAESVDLRL